MNTNDRIEIPPTNQTNGKREPLEAGNGKNSCSGSHSDSVDSTDSAHEKDTPALCITQTLDISDMEDPSFERGQNKVSNYYKVICF